MKNYEQATEYILKSFNIVNYYFKTCIQNIKF